MRAHRLAFRCGLVSATLLAVATAASAQSHGVTIGAGYQALAIDETPTPAGVSADVAIGVGDRWSVVGSIDWSRDTTSSFGFDTVASSIGVGAGLRYEPVRIGRVALFAQALVGTERISIEIDQFGDEGSRHATLLVGGGATLRVVRGLRAYSEVGWRRTEGAAGNTEGVRIALGGRLSIR